MTVRRVESVLATETFRAFRKALRRMRGEYDKAALDDIPEVCAFLQTSERDSVHTCF